MNLPYVCCQHHLVDVVWRRVIEQPSVIERTFGGIEAGEVIERTHRAAWPHEKFARDDIDNDDVQRGFQSMRVHPISRQYFPTESMTLVYHRGLVRVAAPGQEHIPYFAGFAGDLITAATWVAIGDAGKLIVPWRRA